MKKKNQKNKKKKKKKINFKTPKNKHKKIFPLITKK